MKLSFGRPNRGDELGRGKDRVDRVKLSDLRPGDRARVRTCLGEGPIYQRLCEMGFVEGTPLRLVRFAPFGDPVEVELHDYHLSLRKAEAALIQVERLAASEPRE
jgi:Fe2+ transport system protein FeoA